MRGESLLKLLPPVRNSIHRHAIRAILGARKARPDGPVVRVVFDNDDHGIGAREAMLRLGDSDDWWFDESVGVDRLLIAQPHRLVEKLLVETVLLANQLLSLIPIGRLPGVLIDDLDALPNLYYDISARIPLMGMSDRRAEHSRRFLSEYADRIFFGTDSIYDDTNVPTGVQAQCLFQPYEIPL